MLRREAGQILSQDARGRVLVSRERRESLLEEYDRSGMSGVKLCSTSGSNTQRLPTGSKAWIDRRRHRADGRFFCSCHKKVGTECPAGGGSFVA